MRFSFKGAVIKMNNIKKAAIESVDSMADFYKSITNEIWNNPELSLKEYKATELYCKVLREHGFTVTEKLSGIDTAFCGSFGSGKPVIGILGEFDALSGLSQESGVTEKKPLVHDGSGHGCGHNLLGVGSLAAAFAVKEYLQKSGHGGTVVFFGCPGEEGGSGKAYVSTPTLMTVKDGKAYARLEWSSSNYDYMIVGTETYYNLAEEGRNSVFEIPIGCWDTKMSVIADTTAMGTPHEVQYDITFYESSIGDKGQLPQEGAKRVVFVALIIIVAGGILNHFVKKKRRV